ncbi:pentatricopeptide repeat protein, putative [Plasmodium gallinaceum]|uniref:Pentatricopeptide repeat protein, putative n=1 Tax=Plasmodium gallinaceum TaxID=5849 RepID=A0A1J1H0B9_PLAGA|nr:pentatricopeptide repeat protein, putative [Plasmodium gallinaceum]CRG96970.1 pentatricopeptide repeat protein, putative [Plasmodium gallinaceum]
MNYSILFSHFKEYALSNIEILYCKTKIGSKFSSLNYNENFSKIKLLKNNYSTLGQLIKRKKNIVNLNTNKNLKCYKRVNIKKILKNNKKEEGTYEKNNTKSEELNEVNKKYDFSQNHFVHLRGYSAEQKEDKNKVTNVVGKNINLQNNNEESILNNEKINEYNLNNLHEKNYIHNENIKDAVDELFYTKEKKKYLMDRIIFRNNYDYMYLIDKYEEFKINDENNFYNSNYDMKNSIKYIKENNNQYNENNSEINGNENNSEINCNENNNEINCNENNDEINCNENYNKMVKGKNDEYYYFHEVENENNENNINMQFKYLNNNLNISIFSEIGKKDILENCKKKKNMQNEINKNSDAKNIFNNDIYFWLKRKVHRSVDWKLIPFNQNKNDDIIDVTELNCIIQGNSNGIPVNSLENDNSNSENNLNKKKNETEKDKNHMKCDKNVLNVKCDNSDKKYNEKSEFLINNDGNNEMFEINNKNTINGENNINKNKLTYLQKKIAPSHFLKKLNINILEDNNNVQNKVQDKEKENIEKIRKIKEEEKERITNIFLNNSEILQPTYEEQKIFEKEKMNNMEGNETKKTSNFESCENKQMNNLKSEKNNDIILIDEFENMKDEYNMNNIDDKTYEGIVDNSKNVFKKLKENYEMFKKEKMSPYILEHCEKYINYYYGIEKEEKIKEMKKYADLKFYDVIKDDKFTINDFNMLIKSKIIFNKEEEAFNYFNLLKKYDFKINVETYNSLMYTCVVQKNSKLSRLIYLQMIKDLFTPNKNTFCILIKAHILDNDIKSAFHLYRKMIKEEIEVDLPIYSTLIDGLIKHKLYKRAEQFFNYIVTYKNVVPDEILYTIMIKNCSYNGEAEKCLNFYETILSNNLRVTDLTLIEIINCLSKRNDYFHKVFHFYNIYLANDMKINRRLMLYMIIACSNNGNIKRLKEILKTMNKHKIKITNEMYCYIIRTFANNCKNKNITLSEKNNNIKYAWKIIYDLLKNNKINNSYNTDSNNNINGINKNNNELNNESTNQFNGAIINESNNINTKMLNSIVLLYINCDYYEYSINMLKYYSYFNCIPDYYTFKILFKMLSFKLKDYGKVICLYNYMINNTNIKSDEYTFNIVLNAAIKTKSSKHTLFILRHMFAAKIYPTPKMIKKLFHVGRHITEIQLLINSMINQQKKEVYEENLKENQLIQLNIDEYELNLFKEGRTFKTKTELDQVREQFFKKKQRIEKEKRMSKNKKSSNWLPYGQYLQNKKKGGEAYAKKVDKPKPFFFDLK